MAIRLALVSIVWNMRDILRKNYLPVDVQSSVAIWVLRGMNAPCGLVVSFEEGQPLNTGLKKVERMQWARRSAYSRC